MAPRAEPGRPEGGAVLGGSQRVAHGRVALPIALALVAVVATAGCGTDAHDRVSAAGARREPRRAASTAPATAVAIVTTTVPTMVTPPATAAPPPLTAAPAPTAAAPAAKPAAAAPTPEQVGAEAVRLVRYDLSGLPGWQIVFLPGRPGFQGRTFPDRRRIEVYVSPRDSAQAVSYNLAHEIGHAVDFTYSTRASRLAYRTIRRIPAATLWYGCGDCADFATPAGDFAETFGLIVTDPAYDWRSRMGPRPTPAERAAIVALYQL
jgi:hypothetical protein